jgi:hypothetical protein
MPGNPGEVDREIVSGLLAHAGIPVPEPEIALLASHYSKHRADLDRLSGVPAADASDHDGTT